MSESILYLQLSWLERMENENFKALQTNILLNGFKNIIALNIAAFNQDNKKLLLCGSRDSEFSLKSNLKENSVEVKTRTIRFSPTGDWC